VAENHAYTASTRGIEKVKALFSGPAKYAWRPSSRWLQPVTDFQCEWLLKAVLTGANSVLVRILEKPSKKADWFWRIEKQAGRLRKTHASICSGLVATCVERFWFYVCNASKPGLSARIRNIRNLLRIHRGEDERTGPTLQENHRNPETRYDAAIQRKIIRNDDAVCSIEGSPLKVPSWQGKGQLIFDRSVQYP
jgi:hypothetical protein